MTKLVVSPIEKGRIRLRLLEKTDLPMTLRWRNQDHIRRWFVHSDPISPESHEGWFSEYLERDDDYLFMIEEIRDLRRPVGQISIYKIDWAEKHGEFGRLLIGDSEARGKGIAKEATHLLLHHAFTRWGLERIELEVLSDNAPATTIYRDLGFREVSQLNGLTRLIKMGNP